MTIAVLGGAGWLLEIVLGDIGGNRAIGIVFAVAVSMVFATAAWAPTTATFVVLGGLLVHGLVDSEGLYRSDAFGIIAIASVAVAGALPGMRERIVGLAGYLAGVVVLVLNVPVRELDNIPRSGVMTANLITVAVVWGIAWIIAERVRATRALRARAARLEAERDAIAAESIADERARIARELHDVVAHSISVMTVQAGGARRLLGDDHMRARDALVAIEETGRTALAEMRRMVGVMRTDGATDDRTPQPGMGELERLVGEIRDAGLPVTLHVDGAPRPLGAGLDLSAYRIVQEGLTNALKHAGPAQATVTVRYHSTTLELIVEDDGVGPRGNGVAGHGLIGMRERVAVYGGQLTHGGSAEGRGFRVHATLPIDAEGVG